jgi:hypothetical protein
MKLLLPLLLAATLGASAPGASAPQCSLTLDLPDSALQLAVRWRQTGRDLAPFLEPQGLDAAGLKALRVRSLLAQGLQLRSDVQLRAGDVTLAPGSRPLGFTVTQGGAPRFFAVDGQQAVELPSQGVEPGFDAPSLLLQWAWIDRSEAQLHWHVGTRAGAIAFKLGVEGPRRDEPLPVAPDAPPDAPPEGTPPAGEPRDG